MTHRESRSIVTGFSPPEGGFKGMTRLRKYCFKVPNAIMFLDGKNFLRKALQNEKARVQKQLVY